jgi:hypothetical protein
MSAVNLDYIGERAFSFALVFSVVVTFVVTSLLASGFPPDELARIPLFTSSAQLYSHVREMSESIPREADVPTIISSAFAVLVTGFSQFVITLLFGIIALVQTIGELIPPEAGFLVVPLYFVGSFIQVMVWYYFLTRVLEWMRNLVLRI